MAEVAVRVAVILGTATREKSVNTRLLSILVAMGSRVFNFLAEKQKV